MGGWLDYTFLIQVAVVHTIEKEKKNGENQFSEGGGKSSSKVLNDIPNSLDYIHTQLTLFFA